MRSVLKKNDLQVGLDFLKGEVGYIVESSTSGCSEVVVDMKGSKFSTCLHRIDAKAFMSGLGT